MSNDSNGVFIDTWGWLSLCSDAEPKHSRMKTLYREWFESKKRRITTDWVLAESATLIFKRVRFETAKQFFEGVWQAQEIGSLQLEFIDEKRMADVWKLRLKLKDKPDISFVDLSSFVVMKELSISRVATADQHFAHVGMGFVLCN